MTKKKPRPGGRGALQDAGRNGVTVEGDALPHEEQFKTLLFIPKGKRLLALVPVGVPAEWPTIEKRPLESVLHWQVY